VSDLRRIGIDEISHRKGHKYLIVVVDHDRGRLVWAKPGRDEAALSRFFEALGPSPCARLRLISADAAPWIASMVRRFGFHSAEALISLAMLALGGLWVLR
jgi:transposase